MRVQWLVAVWLLVGLLLIPLLAEGQGFPSVLGILPMPAPSETPLFVGVWTEESSYEVGEGLVVHFSVNQPAFIYLFDLQPDGVVRLLFPNAYSQNNYVLSGTYTLPDGAYQLRIDPPTGVEELLIFASLTPLPIYPGGPTDPFLLFAFAPGEAMHQLQEILRAITPTPIWKTGWTAFTITGPAYEAKPPPPPADLPPYPPSYPPFPGYPGDSWYWQNRQWIPGIPASGWYWYFGLDSRWHLCLQIPFAG